MDAENLVAPIKDLLAGQEFADDMVRLEDCVGKLDFAGALKSLESLMTSMRKWRERFLHGRRTLKTQGSDR